MRKQLEIFSATQEDVKARAAIGRVARAISSGQVGIRCIHCRHLPSKDQAKGSSSYPACIRGLNQATRNFQRYHFSLCPCIPQSVREEYGRLKGGRQTNSSKNSQEYWAQRCAEMGLVDVAAASASSASDSDARSLNNDGDGGAGGIYFEDDARRLGLRIIPTKKVKFIATKKSTRAIASRGTDFGSNSSMTQTREPNNPGAPVHQPPEKTEEHIVFDPLDFSTVSQSDLGGFDDGILSELAVFEENDDCDALEKTSDGQSDAGLFSSDFQPAQGSSEVTGLVGVSKHDILAQKSKLALCLVQAAREISPLPPAPATTNEFNNDSEYLSTTEELYSLGLELYELFAGYRPADAGGHEAALQIVAKDVHRDATIDSRSKRSKSQSAGSNIREKVDSVSSHIPLVELGVPSCISVLATALLDCRSGSQTYSSTSQVEADLMSIIKFSDIYFHQPDPSDRCEDVLTFPKDRVWGQENNLKAINGALGRVAARDKTCPGPCELVIVAGCAGVGKSQLVYHALSQWANRQEAGLSRILVGKFDELSKGSRPLSAIVDALDIYFSLLLRDGGEALRRVKQEILIAVGDDLETLIGLVPRLKDIVGEFSILNLNIGGKETKRRILFLLKKLLWAISVSYSGALVIFLDDLQFADSESLTFIQAFVSDTNLSGILFICAHRSESLSSDREFSGQLQALLSSGAALTDCVVEPMTASVVNEFVSATLCLPPRYVEPLSKLVYQKTTGNALFVTQFLKTLEDERLLYYSASSRCWEFVIADIIALEVAESVVQLLADKMLKLASPVVQSLKIAACLGGKCNEATLKYLNFSVDESLEDGFSDTLESIHFLDIAVEEGLMHKSESTYAFSHDRIRESAYSLIPEDDRNMMHLQIARKLMNQASENDLDSDLLYVIADQVLRIPEFITNENEKVQVAKLLSIAGQRSLSSSSFLPASIYLETGISLVEGISDGWETQYDLNLELYTSACETFYVLNNYEKMHLASKNVSGRAHTLFDKLRVWQTSISARTSQGKMEDALQLARDILNNELGETLPGFGEDDLDQPILIQYMSKTEEMLKNGGGLDNISWLPMMDNKLAIAKMRLLSQICLLVYFAKPKLLPIIAARMLQLTLEFGVSKESSIAFAIMGTIQSNVFNDIGKSYRFGKVAMSLVKELNAREYVAQVYVTVYSSTHSFVEPLQACIDPCRFAYEVGTAVGDFTYASAAAALIINFSLSAGEPLGSVVREIEQYMGFIKQNNDGGARLMYIAFGQAVLNLVNPSTSDTSILKGDATDDKDVFVEAKSTHHITATGVTYFLRIFLAYIFNRYDLAVAIVAEKQQDSSSKIWSIPFVYDTFYTALSCLAAPSTFRREESRAIAQEALHKMEAWAEHSAWNFQHKVEMLKAEIALFDGNLTNAARSYDAAIAAASGHHFLNEAAIFSERAGLFHLRHSGTDPSMGRRYLYKAHDFYLKWEATAKAEQLSKKFNLELKI